MTDITEAPVLPSRDCVAKGELKIEAIENLPSTARSLEAAPGSQHTVFEKRSAGTRGLCIRLTKLFLPRVWCLHSLIQAH